MVKYPKTDTQQLFVRQKHFSADGWIFTINFCTMVQSHVLTIRKLIWLDFYKASYRVEPERPESFFWLWMDFFHIAGWVLCWIFISFILKKHLQDFLLNKFLRNFQAIDSLYRTSSLREYNACIDYTDNTDHTHYTERNLKIPSRMTVV